MDNHKQNDIDTAELIKRAENRCGLNADEVRSLLSDSDITTERLQTAATALKRDIFSESVTLAASIQVGTDSTETEIQRVIAAGHKRLHINLSGDSQTDRTALEYAAEKFDTDHCGCIELTMNSNSGANDIGSQADLRFIHPRDLAAYESADSLDSSKAQLIGVDIDLDGDPESLCRQLGYIGATGAFVATVRVCTSATVDKAVQFRSCALLALALPYAKIGVELGSTDDIVEFVKSGVSLLYLHGNAITHTDSVVLQLTKQGILSGFCTACVACDRYTDGYKQLCSDGQLYNYCYLNSLLSLREYASDHAPRDTRIVATDLILNRLYGIANKQVRDQMALAMKDIRAGERGFRF